MGKLVLTRRAGESVKLVEANGPEWLVIIDRMFSYSGKTYLRLQHGKAFTSHELRTNDTMSFAGGSLELRPTKRRWPDQAVLAFDFPRDVKIVRTEIA